MKRSNIIIEFINKYFDQNLDIQIQYFNLLALMGIVTGIVAALIAVTRQQLLNVIIVLTISVLSFSLLYIAEKKKCYNLCSWIMVIAIFMIIIPLLFVFCVGYRRGMSGFFVLAVILTANILEKREKIIAITLEFALYIACYLLAYFKPEITADFHSEYTYIIETALNFVISCTLLLTTVMLRKRMFNIRHEQIQELNRELIARNEALARYDIMKSDFLATVAHEISTPLAVISASSGDTLDLLKESPLNMKEIIENQEIIEKRVKLIDNIVLDLMDTVAIENGRLYLDRQPVNLSKLLKNVCDTQFKKLDINNNHITYAFKSDLPCILADPSRIEQVMINLLSNAARHTKRGTVTVKLTHADNGQLVSVTDNGEGMDVEMAQIVLNQYVSTKTDYWRHGVGLYICRRIIMAHGGDIWIESERGRGTTIYFTIQEGVNYEGVETVNFNR